MLNLTKAQKRTLMDITGLQKWGRTETGLPIRPYLVRRLVEKGVLVEGKDGEYHLTEQGQEVYESITLNTPLV